MRFRISLWQAAVLLLGASALAVSCSSKHSGSSSTMPSVTQNGPPVISIGQHQAAAANYTKCCAFPQPRMLGVTSCVEVSDATLADPSFTASRAICTIAGACYFGCPPATGT